MTNSTALINIGELSKSATVLIEKVSDAIGGFFELLQNRRVAQQAEAEAEKIMAVTRIEITKLQRHALPRSIIEEAKKQNNIEAIMVKALPQVEHNAKPHNMKDDWISNFFDKCRLIYDNEMQILWSKVLAGEVNSPGTHSKRTVNFLGSLDKSDVILFQSLCGFCWHCGLYIPLIYTVEAEIYNKHGINFDSLKHLDEIGLVNFDNFGGFLLVNLSKKIFITYYGKLVEIEFENEKGNQFDIGKVALSNVGQELAPCFREEPIPEFFDYMFNKWTSEKGFKVLSPSRNSE